jgi:hypothetical protein
MTLTLSEVVYLDLLCKELFHEGRLVLLIHKGVILDKLTDGILGVDDLRRGHLVLLGLFLLKGTLDIEGQYYLLSVDSLTHKGALSSFVGGPRVCPRATARRPLES